MTNFPQEAIPAQSPGLTPDGQDDSFYQRLLDSLFDGVYFVDRRRRITYWNRGAENITGYRAEEVIGKNCSDNLLVHVDDTGKQLCIEGCPLSETLHTLERHEAELYLQHKHGHRIPVSVRVAPIVGVDGRAAGAVEVFSDISAKKETERRAVEFENLAYSDTLTGIANRRYAEMRLGHAIEEVQVFGRRFALLMVDLDNFKVVNDLHGHAMGDALVRSVSQTLQKSTRAENLVARWGGDEFIVLAGDVSETQLGSYAARIRNLVRSSAVVENKLRVSVKAAVGGTMILPTDTIQLVVKRADALMYQDKAFQRALH
jgi:diguanylate cyclase (GGDEF)-like protein/PAS domain S-box-containing protein